jgi:hypothetical protein
MDGVLIWMDSISFFLDFPLPTLNEMIRTARGNKFAAAAQKKKYTDLVAMEIVVQTERPHFEAISLDITWIETKKKRDPDNVTGSGLKFLMDGIVAAGIIDDDDRDHVASITNRIAVSDSRGVVVKVTRVPIPLYTINDT